MNVDVYRRRFDGGEEALTRIVELCMPGTSGDCSLLNSIDTGIVQRCTPDAMILTLKDPNHKLLKELLICDYLVENCLGLLPFMGA